MLTNCKVPTKPYKTSGKQKNKYTTTSNEISSSTKNEAEAKIKTIGQIEVDYNKLSDSTWKIK